MKTVTVVGCGPVGLKVAGNLKKEGFDVLALEEHNLVGKPVNCSGLISKTGLNELGIDVEKCIVNEVKGAKIFAPNNDVLHVKKKKTVAFVLDRFKFDQMLLKEAKANGLEVKYNTKLMDIRGNSLFLESSGRGELVKSKIVVGADGVNSTTRYILGIDVDKKYFVHSIQGTLEGSFDKNFVNLYFGKFAPNFFGWLIPESEKTARVGVGASAGHNLNECFKRFLIEKEIEGSVLNKKSFLIPIGMPFKSALKENVLLVGDAAFHTKATTGGGIVTGLNAANACSQTILEHLKHQSLLKNYDRNLSAINKELHVHWKVRRYLNSLSDDAMNKLFKKLKNAGIEEFLAEHGDMDKPTRFLGKLAKKPKMWFLLPQIMNFLRS